MKINYCLPIILSSKQEIIEKITENKSQFSYFEVWLDYIEELDHNFVNRLTSLLEDRLILLFRRQDLEPIKLELKKRIQIMCLLDGKKSLLDLDVQSQQKELKYILDNNLQIKLISSYHNYSATPQINELAEIIKQMEKYKPEIHKVSSYCNDENDSLRLLNLILDLKKQTKKYIILGMGENGKITRIFGTIWGNQMIFAPLKESEKSAPGQLTKEQIELVIKNLC